MIIAYRVFVLKVLLNTNQSLMNRVLHINVRDGRMSDPAV